MPFQSFVWNLFNPLIGLVLAPSCGIRWSLQHVIATLSPSVRLMLLQNHYKPAVNYDNLCSAKLESVSARQNGLWVNLKSTNIQNHAFGASINLYILAQYQLNIGLNNVPIDQKECCYRGILGSTLWSVLAVQDLYFLLLPLD